MNLSSGAMITGGELNHTTRENSLAAMSREVLDVLVVGGGIVGAGVALDAVTRGLTVGLVEARDIASGTSSRSSKLIHGGLRYLEQLNFGLVREALSERGLLLEKIAPHLVRPVPFLFPLTHRWWERPYVGSGIALYDLMAHTSGHAAGLPRHRHLSRRQALALFPSLRTDALVGAIVYYDAQVDDARFALYVARSAAAYGAHVATRTRLMDFVRDESGVTGARIDDLESPGTVIEVRARHVINATGVWTGETLNSAQSSVNVRASKGVHFLVPKACIEADTGLILRTEKSVLFIIPWDEHWIIGTTDTDWSLNKENPVATQGDVEYLLQQVNKVLARPLNASDIEGVYAGLRPLVAAKGTTTSKLSREHVIAQPMKGLTVVTGGKYTTYRVMAKDAVDVAMMSLRGDAVPSRTHEVALLGAQGIDEVRSHREEIAARYGLEPRRVQRLINRYGALVVEVLAMTHNEGDLLRPLEHAPEYLGAEVAYAVQCEGALHLEDVIIRRARIHMETDDQGWAAADEVATIMGRLLQWSSDQTRGEVENYRDFLIAERDALTQRDDIGANQSMLNYLDNLPRT
jgi:glycerol-3-phosphate dehydrogenase